MMGLHWNPRATEIAIVLQGQGMIRVVCSSTAKELECKNTRFKVSEGDVFVVPRFHPMAQMSFNNESLVFMGFSTSTKRNYPQFLAGRSSILQALDRDILEAAFNVADATIGQILAQHTDSIILDCTSCAEEEERIMEERERQEEEERERERQEEEERRRQEEEEEEQERREEEEEREREEEQRRREEGGGGGGEGEGEGERERKKRRGEGKKRERDGRDRDEKKGGVGRRQRRESKRKQEGKKRRCRDGERKSGVDTREPELWSKC